MRQKLPSLFLLLCHMQRWNYNRSPIWARLYSQAHLDVDGDEGSAKGSAGREPRRYLLQLLSLDRICTGVFVSAWVCICECLCVMWQNLPVITKAGQFSPHLPRLCETQEKSSPLQSSALHPLLLLLTTPSAFIFTSPRPLSFLDPCLPPNLLPSCFATRTHTPDPSDFITSPRTQQLSHLSTTSLHSVLPFPSPSPLFNFSTCSALQYFPYVYPLMPSVPVHHDASALLLPTRQQLQYMTNRHDLSCFLAQVWCRHIDINMNEYETLRWKHMLSKVLPV